MPQEVELKLRVPSEKDISELIADYFKIDSFDQQILRNTYFDTSGLDLHRERVALRVRTKKERYIQTLKTRGQSLDGVHVRGEWEWDLSGPEIDQDCLRHCEGWTHDIDLSGLQPIFETNFVRKSAVIDCHKSVIELAYDHGSVISGERSATIHELELELVEGKASILLELRDELNTRFNLVPHDVSKAEIGYALYLKN